MFEDPLEIAVVVAGILLSGLIQLLYWRRPFKNQESSIEQLEASEKKKDKQIKDLQCTALN
jgi:Tfp pilus assembly protein PilN